MLVDLRFARVALGGGLALGVGLFAGCGSKSPLARAGVALTPPPAWQRVEATRWTVPGTPLAAWAGPNGSSLVVYRQAAGDSGVSAQEAAEAIVSGLANRLANLPGMTEHARRTESWGSRPAARLEVIAPGTGDALAPTGTGRPIAPHGRPLVPTRRVVVGLPGAETIFLEWHGPESSSSELEAEIEAIRRDLRYRPTTTVAPSY